MNDPKLPPSGLGALAALVAALRPDWQAPGIRASLDQAAARPVTGYDLAQAALRAAANTDIRTPAVIALDGQHWQPAGTADRPTPGPRQFPRCQHCGHEITEGRAGHPEHCGRTRLGFPDTARRLALEGFDRARDARRAAEHAANQTGEGVASPPRATLAGERCPTHTPVSPNPHRGAHGETEEVR